MDFWIAILLLCGSGLSLILAFHTFLVNSISARATIAAVSDSRQRKRLNVYVHLAVVSFLLTTTAFLVFVVNRSNSASAGGNSQSVAATCPCPEATPQRTAIPVKEIQTSSATSPSSNEPQVTHSPKGTDVLINAIRYDYSPNALMGKFQGQFLAESGKVKFVIRNPVFRLAGRAEIWGQRTITGIKFGIAYYDELIKVSRGQDGDVIWSDRFELTATRDHGDEYPENKTIELSVPVGLTDLKGKAVIVQIDNELSLSGKTLEPSYAISSREIFY